MTYKDNSVKLCCFCQSETTGKLCLQDKTIEQRKNRILEQLEIEKENEKKGFKIPETLFGFPRKELLGFYKL